MIERVRLSSLLKAVVDNRGRTCPTAPEGFPLIATNCVKNETLFPTHEKIRFVSQDTYANWFRAHPEPGDLIFVLKGQPGQVCLAPDPVGFCIAQDMVALRADPDKVYPPYLFAALRSPQAQYDIGNMHVGTMIPHFKKGDFDKLFITLPDPNAQKTIGDLYLVLSKKIEVNRRTSETLLALAQTLFHDWFIDFGPVRRKMAGATDSDTILGTFLAPGREATRIATLFPDRLGGDGLPEGWQARPLDQIADFLNGAAMQKFPATPGKSSLPVIKIAELRNGITTNTNRSRIDIPAKYLVADGDFLFSWSGSLMARFWTDGPGALNQHLFKVTSESYPMWFVAGWVQHHMPSFQRIAEAKAVTMGHIKREHLSSAMVTCPQIEALGALGGIAEPILKHAIHNDLENRTLAEMRDYLLPKLMSGKVRVGDIEAEVA